MAIVAAVVVGNGLYLLHIFTPNPLELYSGLGYVTHPGLFAGSPSLDPNTGITAQTLGHLSAVDWLHGHVPWWNPYEGLGAPLAGEMQSAALFPPTLLLYFSNGQVYFHLLLELVAGLSTYGLLTRLRMGRLVATSGAIAFALCGTFSWFSHAPVNPVAFLPMLLWGIEIVASDPRSTTYGGGLAIAAGLALSLYAGFPETAYIDSLLAGCWALARLVELPAAHRARVFVRLTVGAGVGLLLAAPILVAFADYLRAGDLGAHTGIFGSASLPDQGLAQVFLPYVYGSIPNFSNSTSTLSAIWGNAGGYLTAPVFTLALIGLWGRRHRGLRIVLALFVVVTVGRTFGVQPFQDLVNLLPGMKNVAFYRYSYATWTLAALVLAVFGFDDIVRRLVPRWWMGLCGVAGLLVVGLSVVETRSLSSQLRHVAHHQLWLLLSIGWAVGAILVISLAAPWRHRRAAAYLVAIAIGVNALAMFVVPQLSAPRATRLYAAPAEYLARHLGTGRFYSIGPIAPDYGSYFGLASLAAQDIPQPEVYEHYLTHHLGLPDKVNQTGSDVDIGIFLRHLPAFEGAGVRYLLTPENVALPASPAAASLHLVLSSPSGDVYRLPSPQALFTTTTKGCRVTTQGLTTATVVCSSPGSLLRRESYMPGWRATVHGRTASVRQDGSFQRVDLPAGRSVVSFTFLPPHMTAALVAFFVGLVIIGAGVVRARRHTGHTEPVTEEP